MPEIRKLFWKCVHRSIQHSAPRTIFRIGAFAAISADEDLAVPVETPPPGGADRETPASARRGGKA
ncbi:MAG: hypothetical protein QOE70_1671 [Chthoniobacter sp.]|jgi:hypothetical protein|nr:hypothetical protein [Chthoniobacter sp.]